MNLGGLSALRAQFCSIFIFQARHCLKSNGIDSLRQVCSVNWGLHLLIYISTAVLPANKLHLIYYPIDMTSISLQMVLNEAPPIESMNETVA